MADRICSFCRQGYTDETGHNYDICVGRCYDQLERAKENAHKSIDYLNEAHTHFDQARRIQAQDWWKTKAEVK